MRRGYNPFPKREYIKTIYETAHDVSRILGYKKIPPFYETRLPENCMMMFCECDRRYAILYDYIQFKESFCRDAFCGKINAASFTAHEMRHYYQHRQMYAKHPAEPENILKAWRSNDDNVTYPENGVTVLEHFMQPLELDAEVFAYWYVAKKYDAAISRDYIDKDYVKMMKAKYIEMFGEDNSDLYIFDVWDNQHGASAYFA